MYIIILTLRCNNIEIGDKTREYKPLTENGTKDKLYNIKAYWSLNSKINIINQVD